MAAPQDIIDCLMLLTVSFPEWQRNLPNEDAEQTYRAYIQLLGDLPPKALHAGTIRYIQTQKFFPKICELREATFAVIREEAQRPALATGGYDIVPPPPLTEKTQQYLQQLIRRKPPHFHEEPGEIPPPTPEAIKARQAELKAQARRLLAKEQDEHGN